MIVSKYKQDGSHDSNHENDDLLLIQNEIRKGELVKDWLLTEVVYTGEFVKPNFNGVEWLESATQQELDERVIYDSDKTIDDEYFKYKMRAKDGVERYLKLSAEFRLLKLKGDITHAFHRLLEKKTEPVWSKMINGQFITALESLENIGSSEITQELYDRFHLSLTSGISEHYS